MRVPPLLLVTPGDDRRLEPWIEALGHAGAPAVLLREPSRPRAEVQRLAGLAESVGMVVVLHDRHPDARAARWPVHLPGDGRAPPVDRPWGVSCHEIDEVRRRLAQGAAYALLSPVWPPTSKPDDRRPALGLAPFEALGPARSRVLALGGLSPARLEQALSVGAAGGAVLGDVFGRATPAEGAERVRAYLAVASLVGSGSDSPSLGATGSNTNSSS